LFGSGEDTPNTILESTSTSPNSITQTKEASRPKPVAAKRTKMGDEVTVPPITEINAPITNPDPPQPTPLPLTDDPSYLSSTSTQQNIQPRVENQQLPSKSLLSIVDDRTPSEADTASGSEEEPPQTQKGPEIFINMDSDHESNKDD